MIKPICEFEVNECSCYENNETQLSSSLNQRTVLSPPPPETGLSIVSFFCRLVVYIVFESMAKDDFREIPPKKAFSSRFIFLGKTSSSNLASEQGDQMSL
jgi:hypothetical protein